jgi:hypothetical protein
VSVSGQQLRHNGDVHDWHLQFLETCCDHTTGAVVGEWAFNYGPAIWVGKREVAHFDDEGTLDLRLTRD